MIQEQQQFPYDINNRIQKLYDINIYEIFNRTKLQNYKKKFYIYKNYVVNKFHTDLQPKYFNSVDIRNKAYLKWEKALIHDPTSEIVEKLEAIFHNANEEYHKLQCISLEYTDFKDNIDNKIKRITDHQRNIYKHYKKCFHCKNINKVSISGCKLKHKLCSDCSYDITECPVCEKDLGLLYCAICMENKKEIIETGCENKHQTCKECLDKIIEINNMCPFCRDSL